MLFRTLTSILFVLVTLTLAAQSNTSKKVIVERYRAISIENPEFDAEAYLAYFKFEMGLSDRDEWVLDSSAAGRNNHTHHHYQQLYSGLPVHGSRYALHMRGGKVVSANGTFLPRIKLDVNPTLSLEEVWNLVKVDMGSPIYDLTGKAKTSPLLPQKSEAPELVIIDKKMPSFSGRYALVYKLDAHSKTNLDSRRYFVDAHGGNILKWVPLQERQGVPAKCETLYFGQQTMTVDSVAANTFVLNDPTRGMDGITVTDADDNIFESSDNVFDAGDEGFEKGAMDALYCTAAYYDVLEEHFDWKGLDNEDGSFEIGVNAFGQEDYINAFWNGNKVWIGNGDCNHGPLTTLTVIGHEFAHGIIDNTSDLIYSSESGAINESIADVMGKMLEYQVNPDDFTWGVGAVFGPEELDPFRLMDEPLTKGHPAYYKGVAWIDDNDVHINSSIGNLWYVLLSQGGSGTMENGEDYMVSAEGHLSAAQFIFHINRHYLGESSGYNDYYEASLLAAEELYPGDQDFVDNVMAAWAAVGLPNRPDVLGDYLDLAVETQSLYQLCGYGSYLSAYVDVENVGSLDYESGMNGRLVIRDGDSEVLRELTLSDDLKVDEVVRVELDSILEITGNFARMTVELELDDDIILDNNDDQTFVLTREFAADNLSVSMIFAEHVCFSEEQEVSILIRNESCETVFKGTEMEVLIVNDAGDIVLEEDYVLERNLSRSAAVDLDRTILIPRKISDNFVVSVAVKGITDPDLSDNTTSYPVNAFRKVDVNYENSFSMENDLKDNLLLTSTSRPSELLSDFMGDSAFYVTGIDGNNDELLCPEARDNFTGAGLSPFDNIKAVMRYCADLAGEITPNVQFDLVQYRNANNLYPSDASSSLLVEWMDLNTGEEGEQIISGQQEDLLVTHDLPLPENFRGQLKFSFVAINGGASDEMDGLFFDNMNFGKSVSTESLEKNKLTIYPNPAETKLNILTDSDIQLTQVMDIHGRLVMQDDDTDLDLASLEAGTYMLQVSLTNGTRLSQRFIKI